MNMEKIDSLLVTRLRRVLKREARLVKGPPGLTATAWFKPEVFVHSSTFEDFGGATPEGTHTARRTVTLPPSFKGFAEERPGRIVVEIHCFAAAYALVQKLCALITPTALLALELLPEIPLVATLDNSVQLTFTDFSAHIQTSSFSCNQKEEVLYYCGHTVFYLNGFLHVKVTKRGGLRRKRSNVSLRGRKKKKRAATTRDT